VSNTTTTTKNNITTMKTKEEILKELLNRAIYLAGQAWELADAYAGGESESAEEIAKQLTELEKEIEYLEFNS
jgi:hypothetical protein